MEKDGSDARHPHGIQSRQTRSTWIASVYPDPAGQGIQTTKKRSTTLEEVEWFATGTRRLHGSFRDSIAYLIKGCLDLF